MADIRSITYECDKLTKDSTGKKWTLSDGTVIALVADGGKTLIVAPKGSPADGLRTFQIDAGRAVDIFIPADSTQLGSKGVMLFQVGASGKTLDQYVAGICKQPPAETEPARPSATAPAGEVVTLKVMNPQTRQIGEYKDVEIRVSATIDGRATPVIYKGTVKVEYDMISKQFRVKLDLARSTKVESFAPTIKGTVYIPLSSESGFGTKITTLTFQKTTTGDKVTYAFVEEGPKTEEKPADPVLAELAPYRADLEVIAKSKDDETIKQLFGKLKVLAAEQGKETGAFIKARADKVRATLAPKLAETPKPAEPPKPADKTVPADGGPEVKYFDELQIIWESIKGAGTLLAAPVELKQMVEKFTALAAEQGITLGDFIGKRVGLALVKLFRTDLETIAKAAGKPADDASLRELATKLFALAKEQGKGVKEFIKARAAVAAAKLAPAPKPGEAAEDEFNRYKVDLKIIAEAAGKPTDETSLRQLLATLKGLAVEQGIELSRLIDKRITKITANAKQKVISGMVASWDYLESEPSRVGAITISAIYDGNLFNVTIGKPKNGSWDSVAKKLAAALKKFPQIKEYIGAFTLYLEETTKSEVAKRGIEKSFRNAFNNVVKGMGEQARLKINFQEPAPKTAPTPPVRTGEALVEKVTEPADIAKVTGAVNLTAAAKRGGAKVENTGVKEVVYKGVRIPCVTVKEPGSDEARGRLFKALVDHIYAATDAKKVSPAEFSLLIVAQTTGEGVSPKLMQALKEKGTRSLTESQAKEQDKYLLGFSYSYNQTMSLIKTGTSDTNSYYDNTVTIFLVPKAAANFASTIKTDILADTPKGMAGGIYGTLLTKLGLSQFGGELNPEAAEAPDPAGSTGPAQKPASELPTAELVAKAGLTVTSKDQRRGVKLPEGTVSFMAEWNPEKEKGTLESQIEERAAKMGEFLKQFGGVNGVLIFFHPGTKTFDGLQRRFFDADKLANKAKGQIGQKLSTRVPIDAAADGFLIVTGTVKGSDYAQDIVRLEVVALNDPSHMKPLRDRYRRANKAWMDKVSTH